MMFEVCCLFLFAFAKKSTKNLSKIIAHWMREGLFRLIPRGLSESRSIRLSVKGSGLTVKGYLW